MLAFSVLSSGSKGNAIFITDNITGILLDCGISYKQLAKRFIQIGRNIEQVDAVLLSHEHSDHTCGLGAFLKKRHAKIYATGGTFAGLSKLSPPIDSSRVIISPGQSFNVGSMNCQPFSVFHDALEPIGYKLSVNGLSIGILTDCGVITSQIRDCICDTDALILESNHDPNLLESCHYPWLVKQRILSNNGHLSNQAAGVLISDITASAKCRLKVVVAAHISENANRPDLAVGNLMRCIRHGDVEPNVMAASAYKPTPLVTIDNTSGI